MSGTDHEDEGVRQRTLMLLPLSDDGEGGVIAVDHVYLPDGCGECENCGGPAHDPGMVGLMVDNGQEIAGVLLTAAQALVVAERLQRGASLVHESSEDAVDLEREAARYAAPERRADDGQPPASAAGAA
jgi:hypothetical protein